jgi:hypothetical protein
LPRNTESKVKVEVVYRSNGRWNERLKHLRICQHRTSCALSAEKTHQSNTTSDDEVERRASQQGTTTKHTAQAKVTAFTIKRMLIFEPPVDGGRKIKPKDIGVVTPYTGQVLEIWKELRNVDIEPSLIFSASTNHAQGKQRPIFFFSIVVNTGLGATWHPGWCAHLLREF